MPSTRWVKKKLGVLQECKEKTFFRSFHGPGRKSEVFRVEIPGTVQALSNTCNIDKKKKKIKTVKYGLL